MAKKLSTKKKLESSEAEGSTPVTPVTFEESLSSLESIVQQLETGKLPLGESLAQYEEGVGFLKTCYSQLSSAERRIELLSGVDAEGNPIAEPLPDEGGGNLAEKAKNRSKRRSTGPVSKKSKKPAAEIAADENDVDDSDLLF